MSPDYAAFRLTDEAPFDAEYLLMFLKSEQGRAEIERESRAVRRRLYIDGLQRANVPLRGDKEEAWWALIGSFAAVRRHLPEPSCRPPPPACSLR